MILDTVAVIGAAYYIFLIAVKMDLSMTFKITKNVWKLSLLSFLSSVIVMVLMLHTLSPTDGKSRSPFILFLATLTSFSSFPVIAQALQELNLITSELGQLAMSSAMVNDIIQWGFLLVSAFLSKEQKPYQLKMMVISVLLIIFCLYVIRPALWRIVERTHEGKPVKEIYIILILLGVLIMASIFDMIGILYHMGPLILGLIMPSGPPLGATLVEKTESIILGFFLPCYFVAIGLKINLAALIDNWRAALLIQSIMFVGELAKLIGSIVVSVSSNLTLKNGFLLGLTLNIKGIIELINFSMWYSKRVIDQAIFTHLVLFVLLNTGFLTPLVGFLCKPHSRLELSTKNHRKRMRTIQTTPSNSEFRILTCLHDEEIVHSIITLLEASNPTLMNPISVYVVHVVELMGRAAPLLLPYKKKINKSNFIDDANTQHIMRAFENYSRNSKGPVTIQPYINIAPYKNMHESICHLAQDNLIPFLIIPFHESQQSVRGSRAATSMRDFNINIQSQAPCTVGILVDKSSKKFMSNKRLSFHVGIIFVGGPDDREALAFGARMSGNRHADVSVTLLRLVLQNKKLGIIANNNNENVRLAFEEEEKERNLDEHVIEEFKLKNLGNACVVCRDVLVDDGIGGLKAIRGLEGDYDLMIAGKRHDNIGALGDEEMLHFLENSELGVIGDMLASTDFCKGMVSVLVMQQSIGTRGKLQAKDAHGFRKPNNLILFMVRPETCNEQSVAEVRIRKGVAVMNNFV
ncbi:Cation/H(+) antiporter 15 [Quillaja saponaria]|uniref:Cation/H(+) antiporter 15 n=1 Tax=Quillaja saponaria TaxID=32244 RepID=A0AAD7PR04_QUISA|nr:Cation/H(+) antiporter 15 [Quillaja saponaria]